ncbi:thioredoxin [candidate division LCP-89 bacterium B3_LCP]|uniref:Thioredoxin n=1 Tax=candidate division LCP-89 bacterium B3_LCP TaxID=2012998 RepID=A0A532V1K4_UNCL8|nr:MAG: thioredoxin [candidate division LCP-89 bacterium B3_LCP]
MEKEITLTDSTFVQEIDNSTEPVLVDFWAPWCGPCQMVGPILSELAEEYDGSLKIGKLNVDENQQTAARFGITGIPTMLLFKDGKMVERWVGALPKPALETALKPHLAEKV